MPSRFPSPLRSLQGLVLLVSAVLALRLVQIQVLQHEDYRRVASRQWETKVKLPALRGNIFDRHGTPLALGTHAYRLSCDPQAISALAESAGASLIEELSALLDRSSRSLRRELRAPGRYLVLHDELTLSLEERERLEQHACLHLERRAERLYPLGELAAPLLGLINDEGSGVSGLELGLESILAGEPGQALIQKDERGRPIITARNRILVQPRRGGDVVLTIDQKAQAIAEQELRRAVEESGAKRGSAVILDPRTGDLLALASYPSPGEEGRQRYRPEEWQLLPVQAIYEPGSTLKALTSIALLEQGGVTLTSQVDAEDGVARFEDGTVIRDDKPHYGFLTFREAFLVSSNICFAKFSADLSDEALYACLRDLNFGNSFGLVLPGEERGLLRKTSEWSKRSRKTLIFGHEMSATPLQITAALGALANGGLLMKPRILSAALDPESGEFVHREPLLLRRVCREQTARTLRELMEAVVLEGTGKQAAVKGMRVGGKTGTAQKFNEGRLARGLYMASFVGLAPVERPRVVVGIFIDEPDKKHFHGGQSAAPAFASIVERLAISTEILRESAGEAEGWAIATGGPRAPRFLELDPEMAASLARAEDIHYAFRGRGRRVVAQEPAPGCLLRPGDPMLLVLGDPETPAGEAPDLLGLSLREARRLALERGYRIEPRGRGFVVRQSLAEANGAWTIVIHLALPKEASRS